MQQNLLDLHLMYKKEEDLISACVRKEKAAQRELYEKYSPRLFALCIRYMGSREAAKDVLQDSFVVAFTKIKTYNGIGSFEGWLRRIIINTALMELRKNSALKNYSEVDGLIYISSPNQDILQKIEGKDIMRYISQMPLGYRMVFNLSVIEGYSHHEIAGKLNISEGTSRSQLSRARIWLQEKINSMNEFKK